MEPRRGRRRNKTTARALKGVSTATTAQTNPLHTHRPDDNDNDRPFPGGRERVSLTDPPHQGTAVSMLKRMVIISIKEKHLANINSYNIVKVDGSAPRALTPTPRRHA